MKHNLNILQRQSGKTSLILLGLELNKNSQILVPNSISRSYRNRNIKSCLIEESDYPVIGKFKSTDTIYIDEYFKLDYTTKVYLFDLMMCNNAPNIVAYGTPVVQYTRNSVDVCRKWWEISIDSKFREILKPEKEMFNDYDELLYNLIVHPKVEVNTIHRIKEKTLPRNVYEMEVLGNIYKD